MPRILCALLLGLALAAPARAGDEPGSAPPAADPAQADAAKTEQPKAELDKTAPAIELKDTTGRSFSLQSCAITNAAAEAAVRAAAQRFGAAKDAALTTKIEDLDGMQDEDGSVDTALRRDLVVSAGEAFGLTATEDTAAGFQTLQDLVTWIEGAKDAPIVLFTWSPRCPSVMHQNDRIVQMVAKNRLRAFAISCNAPDTDEMVSAFRETYEFSLRVFPDREQKVTDVLGGRTTPHFFLFDTKGVLRYRGALDNDPNGYMDDAERQAWLADAAAAVRAGKPVTLKETEPAG